MMKLQRIVHSRNKIRERNRNQKSSAILWIYIYSIYLNDFSITPKIIKKWPFWGPALNSTNYSKSTKLCWSWTVVCPDTLLPLSSSLRLDGVLIARSLVCYSFRVFCLPISLLEGNCLVGESARRPTWRLAASALTSKSAGSQALLGACHIGVCVSTVVLKSLIDQQRALLLDFFAETTFPSYSKGS